ncbi:hypothetical protein BU26DRAFT_518708 [Trematosphaeria pertusa]|uniref:Uncharacterized protein n=1 Tax=Trematosphaeria pertusa TaxID=390896 RepID=A0A6A6IJQ1_9PLEO|nr:uncharacterized protein BU26DRAFT_518708 [Trematosphaeria pertusa]KAF2250298.1 hypothetical protein BU26DRAFT_518708 [Trematosphaeria pertusa]
MRADPCTATCWPSNTLAVWAWGAVQHMTNPAWTVRAKLLFQNPRPQRLTRCKSSRCSGTATTLTANRRAHTRS